MERCNTNIEDEGDGLAGQDLATLLQNLQLYKSYRLGSTLATRVASDKSRSPYHLETPVSVLDGNFDTEHNLERYDLQGPLESPEPRSVLLRSTPYTLDG